ncbi:hypothetical protein [Chryseobacterium sp.]|uniref:hypothetical protein n=1 Tax=Chryseobacterium sp. TaxID=1871047 RepID=UPI00289BA6D0|nr:hypothetical protein [Chryseobacterium sp.]
MDLHVNDRSFVSTYNAADNYAVMLDFVDVCEKTEKYFIEKIFVPEGYGQMEITNGLSFANSFHQIVPRDEEEKKIHSRIKSILVNKFKVFPQESDEDIIHWIEWNNEVSVFLRFAHDRGFPTVSFKTHADFNLSEFGIEKVVLDSQAEEQRSKESMFNISDLCHFEIHRTFLTSLQAEQIKLKGKWDALKEPFRFKDNIAKYLEEIKYEEKFKKKEVLKTNNKKPKKVDANEQVSLAREIGSEIAKMSGYTFSNHLSKINDRYVFKAFNQSVYLAIDTETVSFELHDRSGKHRGEYNFKGDKIEEAKGHILKFSY